MRGNPWQKISIRIPKDSLGQLSDLAAAEGVNLSEFIRLILEEWLDQYN